MTIDDAPAAGVGEAAPDLARIQSEIAEEVRRRRASGDFPPGLERELDAMFARYAPPDVSDNFDDVIASAEAQSFIHADVPTASRRAPGAFVKRALRKLMAWYVRFLAQQVTAFAGTITRAVSLLARRVDALETVSTVAGDGVLADARERREGSDLRPWSPLVVQAFAGVCGRVLHTECGNGGLLRALVDGGVDGYGVDPVETLALAASRTGLDVRADGALAHLRQVPDASLGGVVLSGCVDALPLGEVLALAGRAVEVLVPGGVLVVLSAGPAGWLRGTDAVVADLAPGRPLHAETWAHVLGTLGVTVDPPADPPAAAAGGALLERVPDTTPGADVLNANVERLNRVLFAADAYAVVARKPR